MKKSDLSGLTVAVETLGCKVNQYETSYFLELLAQQGCISVPFSGHADVYIVHSCAVTSKAGFQTRQLLRRARRNNPLAIVVAAGCYAQLEEDRLAREGLATHILGNPGKFNLVEMLLEPGSFSKPLRLASFAPSSGSGFELLPVTRMHTGRTRAMLKIQDGCDSFCSYCIVPHVRGRSRSLPAEMVLEQMEKLTDAGYEEIVLTGIHLGQWGKDLGTRRHLSELLAEMDTRRHPSRLRLSSLEPAEIDSAMIDLVSSSSWICPHFHIPLQSGDPVILERMRRPYTPRHYAELIGKIHAALPDAAIGADVLTGFPGETSEQFDNTLRLIEDLPITYLHVFPFSPRPGTPAAKLSGQIDGRELKRRAAILQETGKKKKRAFRQKFVGRPMEVLVETERSPGLYEGLTRNYLSVSVPAAEGIRPGKRVSAVVEE